MTRSRPVAEPDLGAGQQGHVSATEQGEPHHDPGDGHGQGCGEGEDHDGEVLDRQQPGALHRYGEQVAQGPDVGLAGDRVARDRCDRQRQEEPELDGEGGECDEQAVVGDGAEEVRSVATASG